MPSELVMQEPVGTSVPFMQVSRLFVSKACIPEIWKVAKAGRKKGSRNIKRGDACMGKGSCLLLSILYADNLCI